MPPHRALSFLFPSSLLFNFNRVILPILFDEVLPNGQESGGESLVIQLTFYLVFACRLQRKSHKFLLRSPSQRVPDCCSALVEWRPKGSLPKFDAPSSQMIVLIRYYR